MSARLVHALFILLIVLCNASIWSQDYIVNSQFYGIEEGLSHRDVQSIHQDRQGFMWFGTKYGLNRFDGYEFKWFTKEGNGLQSNEINHILEDVYGRIWLFNTGSYFNKKVKSIDIFNPATGMVESFGKAFGESAPLAQQEVVSFARNDGGQLVFLTSDQRLVFYDGQFKVVDVELGNYGDVLNMHWAPTGLIWLVFQEKEKRETFIVAVDQTGKERFRFSHSPNQFLIIYNLDRKGNCGYLINQKGLLDHQFYKITPNGIRETDSLMAERFAQKKLDTVTFDLTKNIEKNGTQYWVRTDKTIEIFDLEGNFEMQWTKDPENIAVTTGFYFARDGKIWVGTQFGVYRLEITPNPFSIIYGSSMNSVRDLEIDQYSQLWIANGSAYSPIGKATLTEGYSQKTKKENDVTSLPFSTNIYSWLRKRDGYLFYVMPSYTVEFEPKSLDFEKNNLIPGLRKENFVWALYEDEWGKIWFGTDHGDIGYFENNKTIFLPPLDTSGTLFHIYQFFEDSHKNMWLATQAGLITLDLKTERITGRFWSGGEGGLYFPFDNIQHICEDSEGSFWLATGGSGLVHWFPGTDKYKQFTKIDGLSNNNIYAVYPDEYDNLWLSSDYGIMRFNKNTHQVNTFLEKDGISHNEFNRISHYQHTDGSIFFGGLRGVTAFHPKDFQVDSTEFRAPLVITKFQQFIGAEDQLVDKTEELIESQTLTLAPNDPFFRLEFAILTYEDVKKVQYNTY